MGGPALYIFAGGGELAGPRWERLLEDGSVPGNFRLLLEGEPPVAPGRYDDGQHRVWDVYRRDGTDEKGRPVFRFEGRQVTGV